VPGRAGVRAVPEAEPSADHAGHAKRAAAGDLVAVMRALGHRFAVAGHDRGGLVAFRLGLDHPETVSRLALLDCGPTTEHLARVTRAFVQRYPHWFVFAQPDLPERAITADPDAWSRARRRPWAGTTTTSGARPPAIPTWCARCWRTTGPASPSARGTRRRPGRRRTAAVSVLVLWSLRDDLPELYGDPLALWRGWAAHLRRHGIDATHHPAEEAPAALATSLDDSFTRRPTAGRRCATFRRVLASRGVQIRI
jgi:haloacetate dehalogenase